MPKKITDDTPTQTAIRLFVYLLENEGIHTLSELADRFEISKQTVSRSLERPDWSYFGKLIKERIGKEVIYSFDKTNLVSKMKRRDNKSDGSARQRSGQTSNWLDRRIKGVSSLRQKRVRINALLETCNNPCALTVLEYMQNVYRMKTIAIMF